MRQIHNCKVFEPMRVEELTKQEKKKAMESRLQTLLVEWGVAPSVVTKNPDYLGIAKLVAAAAVAAE